ncbi:MAG: hypothetical protein ABIU10_02755 [Sphingomicrobium sp.]
MKHWQPIEAEARPIQTDARQADVRALGFVVLAVTIAAAASALRARRGDARAPSSTPPSNGLPRLPIAGLHGAASVLALSVFADSAIEHSRGRFKNLGMYAPVLVSGLVVAANLRPIIGVAGGAPTRDRLHATAVALGVAGAGFHVWNGLHRPGGLSWHNLFYAAPVGAPAAIALAGIIGAAADHVRLSAPGRPPTLAKLPAGRVIAGLTAGGLAGTVAEVGLLHFRGAFNSRYMWLPVVLPPLAAALLARAAIRPSGAPLKATKAMLGVTAALGIVGAGFHARGISRMMGGWRNWSQNLVDGPPVPAPPSFSALALAGIAALALLEPADG